MYEPREKTEGEDDEKNGRRDFQQLEIFPLQKPFFFFLIPFLSSYPNLFHFLSFRSALFCVRWCASRSSFFALHYVGWVGG
jgi:hypothetical protein